MTGRRRALIIANDEYEDSTLRCLRSPAQDAQALQRVLGDPQIGNFDVEIVRNKPSYVIEPCIEGFFKNAKSEDLLLVHFSGHGLKNESGELFFASANTRPTLLGSTATSADFVQRCMRDSRARRIVLFLDCCYGGAFEQGVSVRASGDAAVLDNFSAANPGGGRGRAVITASSAMEYALEGGRFADGQPVRPSVFTNALVEGLESGEADRDEDGMVSLNELYEYVFDRVREDNPSQTPSRKFDLQGELLIAQSPRRRISAQPIPAELQRATRDSNTYARIGAISELRSRLLGPNVPAAAGARNALEEMVNRDIQQVADAAAAVLREATLQPAEREVDFGRLRHGAAPVHYTVAVLGPPLARVFTPRPSHRWLRVKQVQDGLDISVEAAVVGVHEGRVVLVGPTGEAVIEVRAEVVETVAGKEKPPPQRPSPSVPSPGPSPMPGQRWTQGPPPPAPLPPSNQPAPHAGRASPFHTAVPSSPFAATVPPSVPTTPAQRPGGPDPRVRAEGAYLKPDHQPTQRTPNHLGLAITAAVLFFPTGLPAILYSTQVAAREQAGDLAGARRAAAMAKGWAVVSIVATALLLLSFCLGGL
ncbi:caspase, EACC1-associated type [Micromonospora chersina]|uniref:caspase, EACC1-associated type n=1 Tax=Micromonospora chersina TaxID=47854 RepID=UPI00371F1333